MAQFYTILQTDTDGTSVEKAMYISREMYKMSRPIADPNDGTLYLFQWFEHPDKTKTAILIDEDHELPISIKANQTALMTMFAKAGTQAEIKALRDKIDKAKGKKVKVKELLPTTLFKFTHEQMKTAGFIKDKDSI